MAHARSKPAKDCPYCGHKAVFFKSKEAYRKAKVNRCETDMDEDADIVFRCWQCGRSIKMRFENEEAS